jgi:hypothetical protein
MEPYVIHWLDGIEREYKEHYDPHPPRTDYIYFIKASDGAVGREINSMVREAEVTFPFQKRMQSGISDLVEYIRAGLVQRFTREQINHPTPNNESDERRLRRVSAELRTPSPYVVPLYPPRRIIAKVVLPCRECSGLADIFEEPDLRRYLRI